MIFKRYFGTNGRKVKRISRKRLRPAADEVIARIRAYQNANDALDEAALVYFGVNRSDGRCLDLLGIRGPLTAGELAAAAGLTTGAVTSLVDRLEAQGLVRRRPDEADRRRVMVELTEEAHQRAADVYGPMVADSVPVFGCYTDAELDVVGRFLADAERLAQTHAARVRAMPSAPGRRAAARPTRR